MEQTVQEQTTSERMQLCVQCQEISTSSRGYYGEPLCASCSNDQYFRKVRNGEIVELKIDMRQVKHSTLMMIRAMIQKDIEGYLATTPQNQEEKK